MCGLVRSEMVVICGVHPSLLSTEEKTEFIRHRVAVHDSAMSGSSLYHLDGPPFRMRIGPENREAYKL